MANSKQNRPTAHVNLTKRVAVPGKGMRYVPAVFASNGKLKPHVVLIDGKEEYHPESGSYYADRTENGKRVRKSLGADPVQALLLARQLDDKIDTEMLLLPVFDRMKRVLGVPLAAVEKPELSATVSLNDAMAEFIAEKKATRKELTPRQYQQAFDLFRQSCKKRNLLEIERKDVLDFIVYMRTCGKQYSPRYISHMYSRLLTFFASRGIKLMQKGDSPRYTLDTPEIYEREELEALWDACNDEERLTYEFFLKSGLRKQEVMYLTWSDLNFSRGTVSVKSKPGWSPKAYKGREVPLPDDLLEKLKAWRAKNPRDLVFPAGHGGINRDFYGHLRWIAKKAGLDPSTYRLHKFRSTFATMALRAGFDLSTVQAWMGHSDLKATMRYLKPHDNVAVREKVNTIFA